MASTVVSHNGFALRASAYKVPAVQRYFSTVIIVRAGCEGLREASGLFTPRSGAEDGLFDTAEQAIDAAIDLGILLSDSHSPLELAGDMDSGSVAR